MKPADRYPLPGPDDEQALAALATLLGTPEWKPKFMVDTPKTRAWYRTEVLPRMKREGLSFHLSPGGGVYYSGQVTIPDLAALVGLHQVALGHLTRLKPKGGSHG